MDYNINRMMDQIMRMAQERHDFQMDRTKHSEQYADLASGRKRNEEANKAYLDRLKQREQGEADLERQRVTDIGAMARQGLISNTAENVARTQTESATNVAKINAASSQNVARIGATASDYGAEQSRGSALDVAKTNLLGTQHTANMGYQGEALKADPKKQQYEAFGKFLESFNGSTMTPKERQIETDKMRGYLGIGPAIPGDTISRDNGVTPPETVMPRQATPPPPAPAPAPAAILPPVSNGKTPPVVGAPTAPPQQIMAPVPKKKKTEMNPGAQKASEMLGDFYSRFKMPPAGNLYIPAKKQQYY
jgi:hypothetical protein